MKPRSNPAGILPVHAFEHRQAWAEWLAANYGSSPGLWLRLAKKGAGVPSVSYDEAIEVALCFGWIDGQKKSHDEPFWLQKFTRRSNKSVWSKVNRDKAPDRGRRNETGGAPGG